MWWSFSGTFQCLRISTGKVICRFTVNEYRHFGSISGTDFEFSHDGTVLTAGITFYDFDTLQYVLNVVKINLIAKKSTSILTKAYPSVHSSVGMGITIPYLYGAVKLKGEIVAAAMDGLIFILDLKLGTFVELVEEGHVLDFAFVQEHVLCLLTEQDPTGYRVVLMAAAPLRAIPPHSQSPRVQFSDICVQRQSLDVPSGVRIISAA